MTGPNRRHITRGLALGLAAGLLDRAARAATVYGGGWTVVPTLTIIGPAGDPRLTLVDDAIAFWDRTFTELGSSFRLGAASRLVGMIPANELIPLSEETVGMLGTPPMPADVGALPGNIVVALSDGEFVSFCRHWPAQNKALVAIKSLASPPLTLPNVARNVVAHEMGHAVGLGHNSDPTKLMCGRPAPCRPGLFAAPTEHYFPLTDDEKALLLRLYPADWRPR